MAAPADLAALARLVDTLEARSPTYLTLDEVRRTAGPLAGAVDRALAEDLLVVDEREWLAAGADAPVPVAVCRLNRHHPIARALGGFD